MVRTTESVDIVKNRYRPYGDTSPREELILFALYNKELYGLQIPQAIKEASKDRCWMNHAVLYPVLRSLEGRGFVESRCEDSDYNDTRSSRKRYYRLTSRGVAEVNEIQTFRSNLIRWKPT